MKRIVIVLAWLALVLAAGTASAQSLQLDQLQKMQQTDPKSAAAISGAIQKGDMEAAKKIYQEFQEKNSREAPPAPAKAAPAGQSVFERTLAGDFPSEVSTSLHQFGYDAFLRTAATFTPSASVPVGPDYIVGPGDRFTLTLWGTTEGIFNLEVTREGNITLPKVGVVAVAGVRFGDLEKTLRRHLGRYYSNFNLSLAMGDLKTITVYVVGEVANPGGYSLHALTTAGGALFAAGGPTKRGTMRGIQVLRNGKVIKTIDLYDFLLRGDRSQDTRLQHEDTVFVPLIGPVAGVAGTVYRPAIYEIKGKETIGGLLQTAGGPLPMALGGRVQVTRFLEHEKKVILDLRLGQDAGQEGLREPVRNMDLITVQPLYEQVWEYVNLSGHVRYPGNFQWRPDLRVQEVITQGQLLPTTDLRRAEVIRLTKDYSNREILSIDLEKLLAGDEARNILLQPHDLVRVYTTYRPAETVTLSGELVRPGAYEIQKGERLSDLIQRAGGFTPEAYVYGTVFKRKDVKASEERNLQSFITRVEAQVLQNAAQESATAISSEEGAFARSTLALNQALLANLKAMREQREGRIAVSITENVEAWKGTRDDLLLQDGDSIRVPQRPQDVLVLGQVYGPGAQIFEPELTVKDYLERAGGFTKFAEKDQVFVIQANGFAFGEDTPTGELIEDVRLHAGDAVFVPQQVERYAAMRMTKDIVDIIFKSAVVVGLIVAAFAP